MERSLRMTGIQRFDARKTEYSVSKYIPGIYRIVEIDSRILQGHHAREHMTNRETRGNSIDLATRLQVIMHGASIIIIGLVFSQSPHLKLCGPRRTRRIAVPGSVTRIRYEQNTEPF